MKEIKPLTLGMLHKPYPYGGRHHFVVAALGFFRLGGGVTGFLADYLQWPVVMKSLPPDQPLDAVMPKARGEVLLAAKAYAPQGGPVAAMNVRMSLAGVDKTLRILGDRQWLYGLFPFYQISAPKPFVEMPIGYERAYGGPRYRSNPIGRGYTGNRLAAFVGENHGPMPNIEYPGEPVRSNVKRYRPGGFGPIDIRWSPRQEKHGTYDQQWLSQDFPGLARDTDWSVFNTAPEDQQIEGYFEGGEAYRLEGLHPEQPVIEGRLPDMRARGFVLRKDHPPEVAEEVPLALDTIWFFPEAEVGLAIYRGQAMIADSDALDVAAVMVGYEHRSDVPRPLAHYREVMALRLDREAGALHALNDSQLTPVKNAGERARLAVASQHAEAADLAKRQAVLDEMTADFWTQSEMEPPPGYVPPQAKPLPFGAVRPGAIQGGEVDLVAIVDKARAMAAEAKRKGESQLNDLKEKNEELRNVLTAGSRAQTPAPDLEAQKLAVLARAAVVARDLVPVHEGAPADEEANAMTEMLAAAEQGGHKIDALQREQAAQAAEQAPSLKRKARQAAPEPSAPNEPLAPAVAALLGVQVRQWHRAGICLAGRDLAGADLRGANFSGTDLREIMLEQADLSGANFSGADLRGAVFTAALIDGADFSGARLDGANFSRSRGRGARFSGATMARVQAIEAVWPNAILTGAAFDTWIAPKIDLSDAILDDARITAAVLLDARAPRSRWQRVQMQKSVLLRADLEEADFSGAGLQQSALMDAHLRSSVWAGARLTRVMGGGKAEWDDAALPEAHAEMCSWRGARLVRASLRQGKFVQCDFGGADLSSAELTEGLFYRSLFTGTCLCECRARGADFFQALCRKADFSGADLRDANLVQTDLNEARFEQAWLEGVRLDRNRKVA